MSLVVKTCVLGMLILSLAPRASALEPVTVRVKGVVDVAEQGSSRNKAFQEAMVEAVFQVSRSLLPEEVVEMQGTDLREQLRENAAGFVLTYKVDGALQRRTSPEDGKTPQLVLPVSATVDASQLRAHLRQLGLLEPRRDQPSLTLVVRDSLQRGDGPRPASLVELERFLGQRLGAAGMLVIEPALRQGGMAPRGSALELARSLGADVALDVDVGWRPRKTGQRVQGGLAEVRVRAIRSEDGAEIAIARFEGAGYHQLAEEAFARGIEAIRDQVADNLLLQLDRNWSAIAKDDGAIDIRLVQVSNLLQVSAVRSVLQSRLGAQRADLRELGPSTAALEVEGPLSPGALQERLSRIAFQGFRLEPVMAAEGQIELRVEPVAEPAGPDKGVTNP